jgi:hypothetical protein
MEITMKDRIEIWRHAFSEDHNSIDATLTTFSWNFAAFQTVAKAIEITPASSDGTKPLNSMTLELLRSTYWGSALLAIRRLTDRGCIDGKKGVVSLRSILNDVKKHQGKLTRRVFVEDIGKLAYDHNEYKNIQTQLPHERGFYSLPIKYDPDLIEMRHQTFDFLSGVAPNNRNPDDIIRDETFEKLEVRIKKLDDIADHATIHFAHAATDASRQGRGIGSWGLQQTEDALKLLVETAELVGRWFANSSLCTVLPVPQYNQFEHINQPLFPIDDTSPLEERWSMFSEMTENWINIEDNAL